MLANFFVCVCVVVLFFNVRETRGGLFTGTCELGSLSTCVTRLRSSIVRLFFLLRGRSSSKETMWPSPRCDVMNRNPELIDIDSNFNYVFTLVLSAWQCPPLMNCYRFYVPFFFFLALPEWRTRFRLPDDKNIFTGRWTVLADHSWFVLLLRKFYATPVRCAVAGTRLIMLSPQSCGDCVFTSGRILSLPPRWRWPAFGMLLTS